jgi:enterochelin esterase-like enzyme
MKRSVPLAAIGLLYLSTLCATAQEPPRQSFAEPVSPRILQLRKQMDSGNHPALEEFWREIVVEGAPLVETIPGDKKHVFVTFVYRGEPQIRNVLVFSVLGVAPEGNFTTDQLNQNRLMRLAGTDLWFRTYKVHRDAHFTYYISPNDSLLPSAQRKEVKDWDTIQPDALNPHRFIIHKPERDWTRSVFELGASPVAWVQAQPAIPNGHVETHDLHSSYLGNQRRFWVYTPPGYSLESPPYRLLILFDGLFYSQTIPTATIVDNLLAAGRVYPAVIIMVDQTDRMLELGCYEPFNKFLVQELIPWVRQHNHVTAIAAETIVGGFSRGGLAAACAGLRHPEIFGNVLSESGYFSWDPDEDRTADEEDLEFEWIVRQFASQPKVPLRFYLEVGLLERDHDFPDSPSLLQSNRHMRDVLIAKGYPVQYQEFAGGHEIFLFGMALPDALQALLGTRRSDEPATR